VKGYQKENTEGEKSVGRGHETRVIGIVTE
jgi:hypothetical protein